MNTSSNKGLLSNRISPNERTLLTNLLLTRLVEHRETLRTLLADIGDHDDTVYRFWHQITADIDPARIRSVERLRPKA